MTKFQLEEEFISGITKSYQNRTLKDITKDPNVDVLLVEIDAIDNGEITLKIPRELIDTKKQNDENDVFIILIDGIEVAYQESEIFSEFREITIDFKYRDSEIEIFVPLNHM